MPRAAAAVATTGSQATCGACASGSRNTGSRTSGSSTRPPCRPGKSLYPATTEPAAHRPGRLVHVVPGLPCARMGVAAAEGAEEREEDEPRHVRRGEERGE